MGFQDDLRFGAVAEVALRRWADKAGFFSKASVGKSPAFDLLLRAAIEIKRDARATDTGNLFIETHSHGNPSGISQSQATTYAFITGETAYLVGTDLVRGSLMDLPERFVSSGQKRGRLLPISALIEMPHIMVPLEGMKQ